MRKKSLVLLLLSSLLTGCVAVLAVGAAGGLVVYDKRSVVMIEKDARIFHNAHKSIVTNPAFDESHIVVTSFNRVVLLTGQTPTASLRVQAEKIVKGIPGVERIYNEIAIDNPVSLSQRGKDGWIASQARAKMLAKNGLESGSIRIVTENSVIYLMGIVTPGQAQLAVDVARQIPGVRKVVKVFRYIS